MVMHGLHAIALYDDLPYDEICRDDSCAREDVHRAGVCHQNRGRVPRTCAWCDAALPREPGQKARAKCPCGWDRARHGDPRARRGQGKKGARR